MRALLVGIDFGKGDFAANLEELALLAKSAGATPVATVTGNGPARMPLFSLGRGKLKKLRKRLLTTISI